MSLNVLVKSASNLPDVDKFSKSDPYTRIVLLGRSKQTDYKKDNLNPEWNETLTWEVPGGIPASESIQVEVYDWEMIGKSRILGSTDVPLGPVIHTGKEVVTRALKGRMAEQLNSQIVLELSYQAPAHGSGGKSIHVRRGEGRGVEDDQDSESSDDTEGTVEGGGRDGGGGSGDRGQKGQEGRKHGGDGGSGSGRWRTHHKRRGRHGQKILNRLTDFQVRVHVLEARRLVGSCLNPVVKVVCGKEIQQTSTQKGTNNPFFDEVFFFNFRERPDQVFDYVTEVKVYDAKKIFSDALIGSFNFDLGLVYDEEDHCYIHKWLLLTDPLDLSSEVKGYLKISIQVLGPGDNPKHSPSPIELIQEKVDIESNLLRPSCTRLEPATLTVRILCGEDLPQMDPGYFDKVKKILHVGTVHKEFVDPYCTVNFAGHQERTQVVWNKQDPEWNKQINLGVRFPSMCERIRFQIKDRDVNVDDFIGTFYLHMSEISSPGEKGFLPTFGPCFINCYGSPREFSVLPDKYEHLNKGLIEGVSYRGRVMVEVGMSLGRLPATKTEDIKKVDLTPFLRRRRYRLYCAFYSATMVYPYDQSVEFEVSIGNYGNRLDSNSPVQVSTTPPCNPVYDGKQYYYLPWKDKKPVVQIDSQWEDCSYRIESLNLILLTAESFKNHLDSIKKMMEVEGYNRDAVMSCLGEMLDFFIKSLYEPTCIPGLPKEGFTQLDRLTREQRVKEWGTIRDGCDSLRRKMASDRQDPDEIVDTVEGYISQLKNMAFEPQNSVPDVIIWMLSGNKRVAVKRIPSHELVYSSKFVGECQLQGKHCGKLQTLYLTPPAMETEEETLKGRAQVRARLWLGLERDQDKWTECCPGGELAVLAETYENENWVGKWCNTHWSDASGKIKQEMADFEPPPHGWRWADASWTVQPEYSSTFEPEEGLSEWTEEIFENQTRHPFSHWPDESDNKTYWTDMHGTEKKGVSHDTIEAPRGWHFSTKSKWEVDMNRVVDGEGWEYTVHDGLNMQYVPFERNIHHSRRRRWIRVRVRDSDYTAPKEAVHEEHAKDGWEYASLGRSMFHTTEGRFDVVRRRRYVRKLVSEKPGARAVFTLGKKDKKKGKHDDHGDDGEKKKPHVQVPRMYVEFKECHMYHLRAYLYQGRDMYGSDRSGLSDPYAIISLGHYSSRSRVVKEKVCPVWDQTVIISNIKIFGDSQSVLDCPPPVVLEFFDEDKVGKDEFLGSSTVIPTVRQTLDVPVPQLNWYDIIRYSKSAGEMLAAFELILDEISTLPSGYLKKSLLPPYLYLVPKSIRPTLQNMRIEVLCWGVRDMKKFQLLSVSSPLVEVECGGKVVSSEHIMDVKKNPNFPKPVLTFSVSLPINPLYCPPIKFRILDKRTFGRLPMVGLHVVKSISEYLVKPEEIVQQKDVITDLSTPAHSLITQTPSHTEHVTINVESEPKDDQTKDTAKEGSKHDDDSDFDWWSRYYCSIEGRSQDDCKQYGHLEYYRGELEDAFDGFTDLIQTFPLYRGKGSRDPEEHAGQPVGYFKGTLKVYPIPESDTSSSTPAPPLMFSSVPSTDPVEVIVRVYIIKGIKLHPRDPDGKSDPYIKVKIGKKSIGDRDSYIPSNLNPIFGQVFELPATLPLDHTLTVSVMDWDRFSPDDLIGETKIDLENRFLSRHRATCGLPQFYSEKGPNKWRDQLPPEEILKDWIKSNKLPEAEWSTDGSWISVTINGEVYTLQRSEPGKEQDADHRANLDKQQLALNVLRRKDLNLVPEHIETRNLYTPMHPDTSQGQLHMWVDIFKTELEIPPPVDVSPRKPEKYILRVVVWNCELRETALEKTGEERCDIYVKGWLCGEDSPQKTDVHYRSIDGEGNFNWRFVFPLDYIPAENVMVIKKKAHIYSLTKKEDRLPPMFTMQIWDNDIFTPDDFIGTIDFDLSAMPLPEHKAEIDQVSDKVDNLFKRKRMKGWWPVYDKHSTKQEGWLELEFEIVSEEESQLHPAAKARDEPNMNPKLDPPNRPVTSFLWLTSPWKTFRYIIWKNYKWYIILAFIIILLIVTIVVFVYTAPTTIMNWITTRILPG